VSPPAPHRGRLVLPLVIVVAGVALLAGALVATDALWRHSLLHLRTFLLAGAAIVARVSMRRQRSLVLPVLQLAGLEACATDLMATGSWSSGWAGLDVLVLSTPAVPALVALAIGTLATPSRFQSAFRQLWPLALLSGLFGTTLSRTLLAPAVWIGVGAAIAMLALISAIELHGALEGKRLLDLGRREWRWPLALFATGSSILISRVVFDGVPHVPDEVAYWLQGKYFAAAHLSVPSPPEWSAFALPHTTNAGGRWYSIFPPGWPAVLAAGFLFHVPTLVNPIIAGLTIVVLFGLVRQLYGAPTANLAVALLALSPMFLIMSAGLMSHPLAAFCTVVAASALHRGLADGSAAFAVVTGGALGLLTATRPFEGVLISLVFGGYVLFRGATLQVPRVLRSCVLAALTAIVVGGLLLPYHRALTGDAFLDPITQYFDATYYPGSNRLGFGGDVGNTGWANDLLPGHSPFEAALNAQLTTQLINMELFGWPLGSLGGVALYVAWRRRLWAPADALFVGIAAVTIAGQAFYWYSGADYGARYWYQLAIPCVVLSAKALVDWTRNHGAAVAHTALVMSAVGLLVLLPWRTATKYVGYRGMNDSVVRLAARCDMTSGIVLVRGALEPAPFSTYAAAAILNAPGLDTTEPIFAREVSDDVTRQIQSALPGRSLWVIEPPVDPRGVARVLHSPPDATGAQPHECIPVAATEGD
jgi:hypothetical protein